MKRARAKLVATTPGTWGKVGAGVLVAGLGIGWFAFPWVLDKVVASQINLAQGKDARRLWISLPPLDCSMYVFNVTNPSQVMRGAKPVVQEVGPYCYKEIKDKSDFIEDPTTDTISYSARTTWIENQKDKKCPAPHLTGDEIVVVPNIPMLAILLLAEKDFPPAFLTLVNQALPSIFGRFDDIFMRVRAKDLLFDGIPIDCTATALYPRAVCIALKQNSRALKKVGENRYSFSFFGAKNHTPEEFRYTVKRGTEDGQEIGRLVALDGKPELPFWRGECNKLQGTDGSVFPPFRKKENGSLMAYSPEVCRILFGTYMGEFDYKGVTGYAYTAIFGDSETNPADRCFCPSDDRCRKKGVIENLNCVGAPIVTSHPHFYLANKEYLDGVIGLNPTKEKHGVIIVLEPISGSPLYARKRIQFNIDLKPIRYVTVTQRLPRVLMPLFWAEEGLDLDEDLMGLLEASLFRPIRAVDVIKWMAVVAGVGLAAAAVVLKVRKNRRDKVHQLNDSDGKELGFDQQPNEPIKHIPDDNPTHPFYINYQGDNHKTVIDGVDNTVSELSVKELLRKDITRQFTINSQEGKIKNTVTNGIANGTSDLNAKAFLKDSMIEPTEDNSEVFKSESWANSEGIGMPIQKSQFKSDINVASDLQLDNNKHTAVPNDLTSTENVKQHEPTDFYYNNPTQLSSLEHQTSIMPLSPPLSSENKFKTTRDTSVSYVEINNGSHEETQLIMTTSTPSAEILRRDLVSSGLTDEQMKTERQLSEAIAEYINNERGFLFGEDTQDIISQPSHEDTNKEPTTEELALVEEDINRLMAEMAILIPKKN